jgi:histidinol-phosphatase (PHP family)
MWTNFHTHTDFCDGKGQVATFVRQAIELNMKGLGFSSHAPLPFECAWCMNENSLQTYLSEIEKVRHAHSQIEVYAGLESDYIPGVVSPQQFKPHLDYVIGSIHFVESFQNGSHWEIDGPYLNFLQGLDAIFHNNIRDAIVRYFEITREMVRSARPDVVGHLDKIKIQNISGKHFSEDDPWYQQEILKTIDVIQKEEVIVEVNTRGIYQRKSSTTYPSPWILEILHEKNIPVTINSDAHHPSDLINQFPETAALLQQIGFKKLTSLHDGRWQHFDYNNHGIMVP